jgi:hypothetical protein
LLVSEEGKYISYLKQQPSLWMRRDIEGGCTSKDGAKHLRELTVWMNRCSVCEQFEKLVNDKTAIKAAGLS